MNRSDLRVTFLAGVSVAALLAVPAFAQTQPSTGLEEVVVTATRQTDTVNRVSLSIAAVTQQALDQQGIKSATELTRLVPGLSIVTPGASAAVGAFSIRGIVGGVGAATTGVYLDDTSLTKRANNGVQQNNGSPLPVLFDLERVEVLKGPQGTLYGGSSQGGTIRFVSPEPSLTRYSGLVRLEGRSIKMGEEGYEVGAAFGGPIVQDKLGFRVSGLRRKTPGWIDGYNPYTGALVGKNVNQNDDIAFRAALKWRPTERLSFTLAAYQSRNIVESQITAPTKVYSNKADGNLAARGETFTTPETCINTQTRNLATQPIIAYNPALGINQAPGAVAVVPANCTAATPAAARFVRPSYTYGPFDYLGRDDNLMNGQLELTQARTILRVYSLTTDYEFDKLTVKSITSYVQDKSRHQTPQGTEDASSRQTLTTVPNGARGFNLFAPRPGFAGYFNAFSYRRGFQQEIRFSSPANQRPFNWVGGVYYSNTRIHQYYAVTDRGFADTLRQFYGVTVEQRYGMSQIGAFSGQLEAHLKDVEIAAFAEANLWITEKLKATAGVRFSRVTLDYDQSSHGPNSSRYPNSAGTYVQGNGANSPFTPKVGLTYEFTPNDLIYANAAKGFRAGGVNSPVGQTICDIGLTQFGITANDIPPAYGPDSVWSYEAGGKFRMLENKLQLNGAVYRIDWTGIQSTFTLPGCGQNFVQNGATARSEGVDLQAQFRPVSPLTIGMNLGYTNARYLEAVAGPRGNVPGVAPSINKGDHFAVPKWQLSLSAQYDFSVASFDMYLRGDYQWQSKYTGPGTFGVASYNPFTLQVPARDQLNARFGVTFNQFDVNVFAFNVLDGKDQVGSSGVGISGCSAASQACSVFSNYNPFVSRQVIRPREVGVQINYRF